MWDPRVKCAEAAVLGFGSRGAVCADGGGAAVGCCGGIDGGVGLSFGVVVPTGSEVDDGISFDGSRRYSDPATKRSTRTPRTAAHRDSHGEFEVFACRSCFRGAC